MTRFVRHAEACGFESVYTVEHVVVPGRYDENYPYSESGRMPLPVDCPIPDPLDLLAFLAARTERIRLGTGVMVVPHHHPLILAKPLATIDVLSGGRMLLGAGVGWMREELEATGVDFSRRGRRLDETLAAMRAVWALPPYEKGAGLPGASFHGEFFDFDDVWSDPLVPRRPVVCRSTSGATARQRHGAAVGSATGSTHSGSMTSCWPSGGRSPGGLPRSTVETPRCWSCR